MGVRTLSPTDSAFQGVYGCGFQHADRYHRDLSYHQGTAWVWLTGTYIEAMINIFGDGADIVARVKALTAAAHGTPHRGSVPGFGIRNL